MSKLIGRRIEAAIGLESSHGAGALPAYALGKVDFSVYAKTQDARDEESLGKLADSAGKYVNEKWAEGALGGNIGANSAAYLMALLTGASPSTGSVTDSTYLHTFTLANTNIHKSGALYVVDPNVSLVHKLLMLNSLEINGELEDTVKYTAEFISKLGKVTTQSIPTYVEDYKLVKRKMKIFVASDISGLAAATRISLKSFKVTINKNVTRDSSLGTVEPEDILNGPISIEGELKLNYNDQTYRDYMLNGNYKAIRVQIDTEKLIGATTYGRLSFDLPKVDFFGWEPDAGNNDIVPQTINFKANHDLTNGIMTNITVKNALSTL